MKYLKHWIILISEDIYVFRLVFGAGIGKYFYFPAFRAILFFRLSQLFYQIKLTRPFAYFFTNLNDLINGIWIGPKVKVGKGFSIPHPRGITINPDTIIGNYCSILQQVTIGGDKIIIGDNVEIMADVKIINDKLKNKPLYVGSEAVLGAGTVVLENIPNNAVVVGIPGTIKKYREPDDTWINYRLRESKYGRE